MTDLSPLAKSLIQDGFNEKLSLTQIYIDLNRFCPNGNYSVELVAKHLRKLRKNKQKSAILGGNTF